MDTSNEIGGDGDIPHSGVGSSRRMQVVRTDEQHRVMIEAVEVGALFSVDRYSTKSLFET